MLHLLIIVFLLCVVGGIARAIDETMEENRKDRQRRELERKRKEWRKEQQRMEEFMCGERERQSGLETV
jgi:hypothetical protein